jgi:hypothetical protein
MRILLHTLLITFFSTLSLFAGGKDTTSPPSDTIAIDNDNQHINLLSAGVIYKF